MSRIGRFRFSLETVLKVRRLKEEQARGEVARAVQQLERSRLSLAETENRWQGLLSELRGAVQREWASTEYQRFKEYLDHLKLAIIGWQEQIAQQEQELAEKKLILQSLYQERRLLEQLREKKYQEYKREAQKVWENENEAVTLGRWKVAEP